MSSTIGTLPWMQKDLAAISVGQILRLKPGAADEYKRRHDELWPEMAQVMGEAGISMVIYLHEDLLFLYATAPNQQAWEKVDRDPVTPKWDRYMSDLLVSDAEGKPWFKELRQMFSFGNLI
jgi:L-rhamnose mutarotase